MKPKDILTKEYLKELTRRGKTIREIGVFSGVPYITVYWYFKKYGIVPNKYKPTAEHLEKMSVAAKGKKKSEKWIAMIRKVNKGNKYNLGKKPSKSHKENIGIALRGVYINEKSWKWKGDNISYSGIHKWLVKNYGNPTKCEKCGAEGQYFIRSNGARCWSIHWAKLYGLSYEREKENFMGLCFLCHIRYDRNVKNKKATLNAL